MHKVTMILIIIIKELVVIIIVIVANVMEELLIIRVIQVDVVLLVIVVFIMEWLPTIMVQFIIIKVKNLKESFINGIMVVMVELGAMIKNTINMKVYMVKLILAIKLMRMVTDLIFMFQII